MQDVYTTAEDLALPPHAPRPHDNYVELQLEIIHWSRTWETYDKKKKPKSRVSTVKGEKRRAQRSRAMRGTRVVGSGRRRGASARRTCSVKGTPRIFFPWVQLWLSRSRLVY